MNRSKEAYLNSVRASGCSRATIENYRRAIEQFIFFLDGRTATPSEIADYKVYLADKGLKQSSIRAYLEALTLFFNFCVETGRIKSSPCTSFVTKTKVQPRTGYKNLLRRDEIVKLLNPNRPSGATRNIWSRSYAIMTLFLCTGMRNSELRYLTLDDLDAEHGQILIRNGKGGKNRYVPYPEHAQKAVTDYLNSGLRPSNLPSNAFLFGHGESISDWHEIARTELSGLVERHIKLVTGREGIRTHALRHANASLLLTEGVNIDELQELLGHASPQTTKAYAEYLTNRPIQTATNILNSIAV